MIRRVATSAVTVNPPRLRVEARAAWPTAIDMNEVNEGTGPRVAFYFEGDAPTQAQVDALLAAHNPTPLPPTAADIQLAADKNTVATFMQIASGTATVAQRDEAMKAVIRQLLRWMGP